MTSKFIIGLNNIFKENIKDHGKMIKWMGSVGYHFDVSENNGNTSTRIVIGKTTDGNMSFTDLFGQVD